MELKKITSRERTLECYNRALCAAIALWAALDSALPAADATGGAREFHAFGSAPADVSKNSATRLPSLWHPRSEARLLCPVRLAQAKHINLLLRPLCLYVYLSRCLPLNVLYLSVDYSNTTHWQC